MLPSCCHPNIIRSRVALTSSEFCWIVSTRLRVPELGRVEMDPVLDLYGLPPEQFTAARNQFADGLIGRSWRWTGQDRAQRFDAHASGSATIALQGSAD